MLQQPGMHVPYHRPTQHWIGLGKQKSGSLDLIADTGSISRTKSSINSLYQETVYVGGRGRSDLQCTKYVPGLIDIVKRGLTNQVCQTMCALEKGKGRTKNFASAALQHASLEPCLDKCRTWTLNAPLRTHKYGGRSPAGDTPKLQRTSRPYRPQAFAATIRAGRLLSPICGRTNKRRRPSG